MTKLMIAAIFLVGSLAAAAAAPKKAKVEAAAKPTKKNMSFDSQVVEGEVYRPDYSVVTGEAPGEGWGVLRLRPSFADHATTDTEENQR